MRKDIFKPVVERCLSRVSNKTEKGGGNLECWNGKYDESYWLRNIGNKKEKINND